MQTLLINFSNLKGQIHSRKLDLYDIGIGKERVQKYENVLHTLKSSTLTISIFGVNFKSI